MVVFCDGSYHPESKISTWAFVAIYKDNHKVIACGECSEADSERCELYACKQAIHYALEHAESGERIRIRSDYILLTRLQYRCGRLSCREFRSQCKLEIVQEIAECIRSKAISIRFIQSKDNLAHQYAHKKYLEIKNNI